MNASRIRLWLLDHVPDTLLARPAEWYLAILCVLSGVATLSGVFSPGAVERALPWVVYLFWGACLVAGAAAFMCGLSSIRFTATGRHVITRVPCYRLGLRLLGGAALVYGISIGSATGWLEAIPLFLFVAFCWLRLLTLGGRV